MQTCTRQGVLTVIKHEGLFISLYVFVGACVRSHCAGDGATGEIPLNYTQVVINYRWHIGHINDFILKWGPRAAATEVRGACVRHHLWLCSQLSRTHAHVSAHISIGACVGESGGAIAAFDEHTHYAKKCSMPGLPCASRKGYLGMVTQRSRGLWEHGAERLWSSVLTLLDVSGPKIDLGMQSKYHGNIKVPWLMPQNKQTLQVTPQLKGPRWDAALRRSVDELCGKQKAEWKQGLIQN